VFNRAQDAAKNQGILRIGDVVDSVGSSEIIKQI
jgi:hypothetical protein